MRIFATGISLADTKPRAAFDEFSMREHAPRDFIVRLHVIRPGGKLWLATARRTSEWQT
jgi:hypothetical protein